MAGVEAEGVVVIASRPGVKPPARKFPLFFGKNPDFGRFWGRKKSPYFDYATMLGASGGLAPSFYWSRAFLKNPQKVAVIEDFVFFRKKSWAKMAILSPGPNVDRSRSGGRWPQPLVVGFRRFFLFFLEFYVFFQKKYRFWGQKRSQNHGFRTRAPMFTETGFGGGVRARLSDNVRAPMAAQCAHRRPWGPHGAPRAPTEVGDPRGMIIMTRGMIIITRGMDFGIFRGFLQICGFSISTCHLFKLRRAHAILKEVDGARVVLAAPG